MASFKFDRIAYALPLIGLCLFGITQGCGTSSDKQLTPSVSGSPGVSGHPGSGGEENGSSGAGGEIEPGSGGTAGDDGSGGSSGAGGADPTGGSAGSCDGPNCYSCAPHTNIQFLNACVEGGCPQTFDNSSLAVLVRNNGVLPPLP